MGRGINKALVEKIVFKIRKLRDQKGVTLQEFYNDTGIHLARIESEKRDIPISTLSRVCDYFGITLSEFLKGM
jgi:transcriptional regulator with XRE-family HTH domain